MFLNSTEAWQLLFICAGIVAGFLLCTHLIKLKKNVPLFYCWLGAIAVLGGAAAFFLPIAVNSGFAKEDDGSALRQALLYTTGGLLGVITLGETHRKNNHEKEKNENDHTRQVYAERRSRYTTAVGQLADEKAAVRLGGIYTLAGLVDEWLSDDTLDSEEQQKEGQVIINSLCSYIRSPFPTAEKIEEYEAYKELEELEEKEPENLNAEESLRLKTLQSRFNKPGEYKSPEDITTDYTKLHEEQDVRRAIFSEMSKRSSTFIREKNENKLVKSGIWSEFDFNFSRAPIFYPLSGITIEKPKFSESQFYDEKTFSGTRFTKDADFRRARFMRNSSFNSSHFEQKADFTDVTFAQNTDFTFVFFTNKAEFTKATFMQDVKFILSSFENVADFRKAHFAGDADFRAVRFNKSSSFVETFFGKNAYFTISTFKYNTSFNLAIFHGKSYFDKTTFKQNARFYKSIFKQEVDFQESMFTTHSPTFIFKDKKSGKNYRTQFSARPTSQNYKFSVCDGSKPIELGTATLLSKPFDIPVGTVLFDPDSWDEEKQEYTRVSEPAKPLDKSNDGEEDKSK